MKVLMFGWEFPPHISGGLGTACYGMTKGLTESGTDIIFVLPSFSKGEVAATSNFQLKSASGVCIKTEENNILENTTRDYFSDKVVFHRIDSLLTPYATQLSYEEYTEYMQNEAINTTYTSETNSSEETVYLEGGYGKNLMEEVGRYAKSASVIALREEYDVIHAHDWMTFPAGVLAKRITGKPLIVHIHATEFDRTGENYNPQVHELECYGMEHADLIIAVSHRTKETIVEKYHIPAEKVAVVHNAVTKKEAIEKYNINPLMENEKRVLFMGRITFQKGPEYFVDAAKLVLDKIPNVRFIMAGSGDMKERMIQRASKLKIGSSFHFPGFMKADDVDKMYALADLYVMPSVSEPFGIAPLEAINYDTPVLLSKQSGVAEVLKNSLKVDFWDVHEMANKICAVLTYPQLGATIAEKSREELKNMSWLKTAHTLNGLYSKVTGASV